MRTGFYVEGLSNHSRLLAKLEEVRHRGAPEACWIMAMGEPGFGKSKTLAWLGVRQNALMLRAKAEMNALWLLNEMAEQLGIDTARTKQRAFKTVLAELMVKQPIIIIDEIDHIARKLLCLETLRDLTDMTECVLVAGGTSNALTAIKGYKQIHSRVFDVVNFGAATAADIATIADNLIDVKMDQALIAHIQHRTEGRLRLIMNALARVEAFGRKARSKTVTLEDFGATRQLTNDERLRPQPMLVSSHG
jgi:DNA transposition AAA+ family ATPase